MKPALLTTIALLMLAAPAQAGPGHLYMSEANAYAKKWAASLNGVVTRQPCQRLDGSTASCRATARFRLSGTECHYRLTLHKTYRHHQYRWASGLWHNCVYVG